jgi:hypothetical protein
VVEALVVAMKTETGCTVSVVERPARWPHFLPEEGVLLVLRMEQPDDGRHAELMLTPDEVTELRAMLKPYRRQKWRWLWWFG